MVSFQLKLKKKKVGGKNCKRYEASNQASCVLKGCTGSCSEVKPAASFLHS